VFEMLNNAYTKFYNSSEQQALNKIIVFFIGRIIIK